MYFLKMLFLILSLVIIQAIAAPVNTQVLFIHGFIQFKKKKKTKL